MHAKASTDLPASRLAVGVTEAARLLGVGRSTIFELIREGRLVSIKVGKRRLLPIHELQAFVERASSPRLA